MFKQNLICQEGDSFLINDCIKMTVDKIEDNRVHVTVYVPEGITVSITKKLFEGNIDTNEDQSLLAAGNNYELVITKVITRPAHSGKTASADIIVEHQALRDKLN